MTREQHEMLINWIRAGMIPWNRFNHRFPSNKIKELWEFEHKTDHMLDARYYIPQEDVDATMTECGFRVFDSRAPYLVFNVFPESPAALRYRAYIGYPPRRGRDASSALSKAIRAASILILRNAAGLP